MSILELLNSIEKDELHMARLLILLQAFAGKKGSKAINGLTKLVKLDFLLRYPLYLEYALKKQGVSIEVNIQDYEKEHRIKNDPLSLWTLGSSLL